MSADHELAFSLGEGSPLARVYGLDGQVLVLGTEKNTCLHLAEARTGQRPVVQVGAPLMVNGGPQWVTFEEGEYDDTTFPPVKAAFEASGAVTVGRVESASAKLIRQRALVDFAVNWWQIEKSA
ncbi:AAC(3) family N-acetyltransferase [Deinococcus cavernae]|uniref:AAC(3) family N-acetyltransferase n=1 Tax=Deinococcus cavernae TaxID=2320857 RepID=UPI001F202FC9|nr:AAC(3) family N-acetyltransferase [Deinococcus cavernae]